MALLEQPGTPRQQRRKILAVDGEGAIDTRQRTCVITALPQQQCPEVRPQKLVRVQALGLLISNLRCGREPVDLIGHCQAATGLAAQAYINTYTQDAEEEADALAVKTMVKAGYDPNGLITMLQTLQAEAAGSLQPPAFLLSHPATSERIRDVSNLIRQEGPLSGLRTNDRKFAIIKKRIRLVVGTDVDSESDSE